MFLPTEDGKWEVVMSTSMSYSAFISLGLLCTVRWISENNHSCICLKIHWTVCHDCTLEEIWTNYIIHLFTHAYGTGTFSPGRSFLAQYRICCKVDSPGLHSFSGLIWTLKNCHHHPQLTDKSLCVTLILPYQVPDPLYPVRRTVDVPLSFFLCQEFQESCVYPMLLSENMKGA